MAIFKEIVTKAVLGKGKKSFKNVYTISTEEEPTTILGCWVINHQFKANETGEKIALDGSFDVNIWYSFDDDSKTAVFTKKIKYNELVTINLKEESGLSFEKDIIIKALKQPNCSNVEIKDGEVEFIIEKELGVEVVGETMMKISVEEDEEAWEEIKSEPEPDKTTEEIEKEIEETVEENFIN